MLVSYATQLFLPRLGSQPVLIEPSREVAKWVADEPQPVATFAHEWSGVPFYSGRNDIKNFRGSEWEKFSGFVTANPSTVVIVKGREYADMVLRRLPSTLRVIELAEKADTWIFLAEHRVEVRTATNSTVLEDR